MHSKCGTHVKTFKMSVIKDVCQASWSNCVRQGVKVDSAKVKSVEEFPTPQNKTDVRSFIGLTSYYRRFIENYASRSKPLVDLTKKKRLFVWTKEAELAFQDLKQCLMSAPILQCPDFGSPFKLYTDACDYGVGAVLAQDKAEGETVVAYASRILKPSEIKYAVLQKEALGIVWALKHFYPYLYGRHFVIVTDHRPLKWLKSMKAQTTCLQDGFLRSKVMTLTLFINLESSMAMLMLFQDVLLKMKFW